MEDFTLADLPNETPSPNLPEAVQAPTQPVNLVFMVALTAAGVSLYILYTGIGTRALEPCCYPIR
jgi:hypothetical protein